MDVGALNAADKVVIAADDSLLSGQFAIPMSEGKFKKGRIHCKIGEIIAGLKAGRESDDEITIFHTQV